MKSKKRCWIDQAPNELLDPASYLYINEETAYAEEEYCIETHEHVTFWYPNIKNNILWKLLTVLLIKIDISSIPKTGDIF